MKVGIRPSLPLPGNPGGPPRFRLILAFATVYVIWGSTYLAISIAVQTLPPFLMIAVRCLLGGIILYVWGRWRYGGTLSAGYWLFGLLVGGVMFLGGQGALAWAEQTVPSGVSSLFLATAPLWMILFQARMGGTGGGGGGGRRAIGWRTVAGLGLGSLGLIVLARPGDALSQGVDPVAALVLLLAALSWALGSAVSKRWPLPTNMPVATGVYLLGGGVFLVLAGVLSGETRSLSVDMLSVRSLAALGYLIVFGSVIAFLAYGWLLAHTSLAAVSTYAYVNPVVAVMLGVWLGGETLTPSLVLSAALVVPAVFLTLMQPARRPVVAAPAAQPRPPAARTLLEERCS